MKKLKLSALSIGAKEVLTRAQLKNILAGSGSGSGSGDPKCTGGCEAVILSPAGPVSYYGGSCTLTNTGSSFYCECSFNGMVSIGSSSCVLS